MDSFLKIIGAVAIGVCTIYILVDYSVLKILECKPREYQIEVDHSYIYLWDKDRIVGAISMSDSSRLTNLIIEDNK